MPKKWNETESDRKFVLDVGFVLMLHHSQVSVGEGGGDCDPLDLDPDSYWPALLKTMTCCIRAGKRFQKPIIILAQSMFLFSIDALQSSIEPLCDEADFTGCDTKELCEANVETK